VDLGQGLAGVGPRFGPERDRHFQRPTDPFDPEATDATLGLQREVGWTVESIEDDRERFRTRDADQPSEARAGRAGDRGDRVGRIKCGQFAESLERK
jgi:hypothetical protein